MKNNKRIFFSIVLLAAISMTKAQSPLGKNLHEVIGIWGRNYNFLSDAQGLHVLQYKKLVAKDTVSDLLYFEGFTCVKEVSLRPEVEMYHFVDSLNHKYSPAGYNSWRTPDSTFITLSSRDGFLDVTSFSNNYYKKIAH